MGRKKTEQARSPRRDGYTLIELMMIVTIIGISVVAFAPGFGRAMADRQVSTAARELIRIGRRARSETFGYLRAHLLWITPASGTVQLLRGPNNSCTLSSWTQPQADCALTPQGPRCLENLRLGTWSTRSIALYEEASGGAFQQLNRALCYAPSGAVLYAQVGSIGDVAGALSDQAPANVGGGFVYTLHAGTSAPTLTDRVHRVLFPLGSTARALR